MTTDKPITTPLGTVTVRSTGNATMHICTGELPRELVNGMVVDKIISAVVFVDALDAQADLVISCELENGSVIGHPDTGEGLDCQSWDSDDWMLSVGTENRDSIARRLPKLNLQEDPYPFGYTPTAISLHIDRMPVGEPMSFHFILSYKALPDDRECSTWFAVDVPHEVANKSLNTDREDSAG